MSAWNDWGRHYEVRLTEHFAPWVRHLSVRRKSGKDAIPWDVLQRVKNDVLGSDVMAIEVYPPAHQLVDTANMRHLWEVPFDQVDRIPNLFS